MKNNKILLLLTVVLMVSFCTIFSNVFANTSNSSLSSVKYKAIQVKTGDSLWSIASKVVSDKEDIRDVILAIKKTNHLNNNAEIFPGQILRIPDKG